MLENPKDATGYDESIDIRLTFANNSTYCISNYLGHGMSAYVYGFQRFDQESSKFDLNSTNYVIKVLTCFAYFFINQYLNYSLLKVFKDKSTYETEKRILEKFKKQKTESKHIIKAIEFIDEKMAIVLSPLGRQLKREKLTKNRVKSIFSCVRDLQKNGIIHRDIRPSHFYISRENSAQEYVFLIDLGSAYFMDEDQKKRQLNNSDLIPDDIITYAGSIQFAANEILDCK